MSTIYQWICRTASLGIISVGLVAIACSDLPSGFGWEHTYPEAMVIRENHTIRVEVDQDGGVVGADRKSTPSELQSRGQLVCRLLLEKKKSARHENEDGH